MVLCIHIVDSTSTSQVKYKVKYFIYTLCSVNTRQIKKQIATTSTYHVSHLETHHTSYHVVCILTSLQLQSTHFHFSQIPVYNQTARNQSNRIDTIQAIRYLTLPPSNLIARLIADASV